MRRAIPLLLGVALLAPAGAAQAQEATAPKLSLRVASGLADGRQMFVAQGSRVELRGRVRPAARDQVMGLTILARGRPPTRVRARVRRGRVVFRFTPRRSGAYRVRARLGAAPAGALTLNSVRLRARPGARGQRVRLLQKGLRALGYVAPRPGRDSAFDAATARAVVAYRRVSGMARGAHAGPDLFARLLTGRGRYELRHPRAGRHVEFNWSRQVLVLADGGRARRVYYTSSGKPSTPTVMGTFRFYRKQPGTNSLGMVHSSYFIRGYAIHGYASVPDYPASHGCIRVPIPDARAVYDWVRRGERIFVYR